MSYESVKKLRATNIAKYGSEKAWVAHMREIGSIAGKISKTHISTEEAKRRGSLGGIAKRNKRESQNSNKKT